MDDARKVALVIGNGAYQHASKLDAPRRDALAMADLLGKIGFSVVADFDCDYHRLYDLTEDFYDRLDQDAVSLLYYSGHGAQAPNRTNHLLPVDARLVRPADFGRVTVPLDDVLGKMREKAQISLIFLDACRDDPFTELRRATGTKNVLADTPGLAAVPRKILRQALIGFAAEEGHTALDSGGGQRSPFTAALLDHLKKPGREIRDVMQDVRNDVFDKTDGRQTPWTKEALTADLVLVPNPNQLAAGPNRPVVQAGIDFKPELLEVSQLAEEIRRSAADLSRLNESKVSTAAVARLAALCERFLALADDAFQQLWKSPDEQKMLQDLRDAVDRIRVAAKAPSGAIAVSLAKAIRAWTQ